MMGLEVNGETAPGTSKPLQPTWKEAEFTVFLGCLRPHPNAHVASYWLGLVASLLFLLLNQHELWSNLKNLPWVVYGWCPFQRKATLKAQPQIQIQPAADKPEPKPLGRRRKRVEAEAGFTASLLRQLRASMLHRMWRSLTASGC